MPYIKEEDRTKFYGPIRVLVDSIETDGELNYCISSIIHQVLKNRGQNYQNMNNIIGALECAKLEFIRTIISPYEDKKRKENGPVSGLDKSGG